jgi:hypothetical protein
MTVTGPTDHEGNRQRGACQAGLGQGSGGGEARGNSEFATATGPQRRLELYNDVFDSFTAIH